MLVNLFYCLKQHGVPVSIREHLDLIAALGADLVFADQEQFYFLARAALVKDEKYFDKFDRAMSAFWSGLDSIEGLVEAMIPDDWLRSEFLNQLSEEERAKIESLGGLEELIEKFKQRLEEQQGRHAGGNKWIGTGGTSPFGHSGFHPTGMRIGGQGKHGRAVKVWERREFKNLDDSVELGTRNLKIAMRRLRRFAREGAEDQLDLDDTIRSTAKNAGLLDIKMVPERHNAVKVVIFFDIGGSMNRHVQICEELFSAARSEFKHLEYYYFHNFIYESVWRDNRRRYNEGIATHDVLNRYGRDYKVIFVGDASMSPWEIVYPGGSVEHSNPEAGQVWMERVTDAYEKVAWINPVPQAQWDYTQSIDLIRGLVAGHMYPLTVKGLEQSMA
ncbi:MAG: VWA domain-containing protein [Gammaproteobacteria bacterium]